VHPDIPAAVDGVPPVIAGPPGTRGAAP
jgi:hypothetical protein